MAPDREDQAGGNQAFQPTDPYIRFEVDEREKLHRLAVSVQSISKQFPGMGKPLFQKFGLNIEAGEHIAIIGPNGIGKTASCAASRAISRPMGKVKWAEKAQSRLFCAGPRAISSNDMSLTDWMTQWREPHDDDQAVRSVLGRLLFLATR